MRAPSGRDQWGLAPKGGGAPYPFEKQTDMRELKSEAIPFALLTKESLYCIM